MERLTKTNKADKRVFLDLLVAAITFAVVPIIPDIALPFLIIVPFIYAVIVKGLERDKIISRDDPLSIWLVVNTIWIFIGIIVSATKMYSFLIALMWLFATSSYFAVLLLVDTREKVIACFKAIVISCFITVVIALLQFALGFFNINFPNPFWEFFERELLGNLPVFTFDITFDGFRRTCSTFLGSALYAAYLCMAIPFGFYFSIYGNTKGWRVFGIVFISLSTVALTLTSSRTCYIAFIVGILLIALLTRNRTTLSIAVVVLVIIGLILIFMPSILERFQSIFEIKSNSKQSRFHLWAASGEMFLERPVMGYGSGLQNVWDIFKNKYGINLSHAHNLLLQTLLEGGIIRLAVTIGIFATFFVNMIKAAKTKLKQNKDIAVIFMTSVTGLLIAGITDFVFIDPKIIIFFILILGLSGSFLKTVRNTSGSRDGIPSEKTAS